MCSLTVFVGFHAATTADMLAAPLWEPVQCQFVGLLTVTDFIDILRHYKASGKDVSALATRSIADILQEAAEESKSGQYPFRIRSFVGADSSCSLKQACHQLHGNNQDYLPIVFSEDMRVLACITYTNILEHLVLHFREQRRLFDDSITELGIGTYGSAMVVVHPNQTLAQALELMHQHKLSALPVMDPQTNTIMGVYSRSDITFLTKATDAEDAVRNLELPLSDVLAQRRQDVTTPDALRTCSTAHTLQAIFESFAQVRFNRLYVVDKEERLLGVVSARDLVAYFLSQQEAGVE
jgi:5'-AMP-activated protein kinase, regulatory gamma subunit